MSLQQKITLCDKFKLFLDHKLDKMIFIDFFVTENESANEIAASRHIFKKIGHKIAKNGIFGYFWVK